MKKILAIALSALMLLAALTACGGNTQQSSGGGQSSAVLSGTVNTDGSTSMESVMKVLQEAFKELNPDVTVNYSGTGSGAGIEAVLAGKCDIGLSSRALKDSEIQQGAVSHTVALDGVAVVVNPANSVSDLSVEQIARIFTGEISNWSELGGGDAPIAVYGREAGSGTRGAFEELTETEDVCVYNQELTSTGAVIAAVSTTPGAIGYASLSSVEDSVKALKIGGVAPSEETVLDGSYAIQRPFVFATKTDAALSDAAQAFYDFALSADVADLYVAAGVVPASK